MVSMIVQTEGSILTRLMAADCRRNPQEFVDAVQDALIMAREAALTPVEPDRVSNDRTTLKHHR